MKTKIQSATPNETFNQFSDYELQKTMRDFLEEEEEENKSIWNVATLAGLAMLLVSMICVLQLVGLLAGSIGWMTVMPIIGGIFILFIGFGYWVGDRKRVKRILKKQRKRRKEYYDEAFGASNSDEGKEFSIDNDLFENEGASKEKNPFRTSVFDKYTLHQSKKLYKSRTDKKIAGICGGLAKYFGINSNIIRLLFVITFFLTTGAPIIVYIALAIALDKEPTDVMVMEDLEL